MIGKVDYSDTGKALTDLQFAANFRDQLKAYKDGLTAEATARQAARQAAAALNEEIKAFQDNTSRLGLMWLPATLP